MLFVFRFKLRPKIKIGLFDFGRRPNEKPAAGFFFFGCFVKKKLFPFFWIFFDSISIKHCVCIFCALDSYKRLGYEHVVWKAYNCQDLTTNVKTKSEDIVLCCNVAE